MAEFANTVTALNGGQVETELSMSLKNLVAAVRDTSKSGKITFTVEIAKDKHDKRLIRISTDIKVKLPELPRGTNHFYIHGNRLISLEDAQRQLDFGQEIPEPKYIDIPKGADSEPQPL